MEERKTPKPIVQASNKPETTSDKAASFFRNIGRFIVDDVVLPGARDMASRAWHGTGDAIFGTNTASSSYTSKPAGPSYGYGRFPSRTAYNVDTRGYNSQQQRQDPRERFYDPRYIYYTRGDAEQIKDALDEYIDQYGAVSVADLNSMSGKSNRDYQDGNWGWKYIPNYHIEIVRGYFRDEFDQGSAPEPDGYELILPRAIFLGDVRR